MISLMNSRLAIHSQTPSRCNRLQKENRQLVYYFPGLLVKRFLRGGWQTDNIRQVRTAADEPLRVQLKAENTIEHIFATKNGMR